MALEDVYLLPALHIPQAHGLVPTATGQGPAIRGKGHRIDKARMVREQSDFSPRGDIVQPDTDVAGHRYPRAVRRIGHRTVAVTDFSFAQTGEGTIGQVPSGVVLAAALLGEQHAGQQQGHAEDRTFSHPGYSLVKLKG